MQFPVDTVFSLEQLVVSSGLGDSSSVNNIDATSAPDGGQSVRDHDGCLSLHQSIQRVEDKLL